ncbi:MAG: hypothetical protein FWE53_00575 [Firmicutes bacterium]|nr:hypothetical protein [Bacillota bacterium]
MGVFDYLDKEEFNANLQIKFYLIWGRLSFYIALGGLVIFLVNILLYFTIPGLAGNNIPILIPSMFALAAGITGMVFAQFGAKGAKERKVKCAIIGAGRALSILVMLYSLTLVLAGILVAVL